MVVWGKKTFEELGLRKSGSLGEVDATIVFGF